MKDLRSELSERLNGIRAERESLEARAQDLGLQENALKVLLESELRRFKSESPLSAVNVAVIGVGGDSGSIRSFLERTLSEATPMKLETLVEVAHRSNLKIGQGKSMGRSIHAALLGMRSKGVAESLGNGVWKLAKQNAPRVGHGGAS